MTEPPIHSPARPFGDPDAALRPKSLAEFFGQVAAQAVARAVAELGEDAGEGELIRVALKRAAG